MFTVYDEATVPWWGRLEGEEESNVMFEDGPSESLSRPAAIGKMKKDAHRVIHRRKVKQKNRAKNRVAKAARKRGRR